MGDKVIIAVVVGFFAFMLITMGVAMLSKNNKGQWDEKSRLRGTMRAKHWRVKDTVDNLKDFLLGKPTDVDHWPVAQTVGGILGVTAESGRYHWRSGTTIRPDDGAHIMMSVELPQLPDGAEGDMPEILVRRDDDDYWTVTWGTNAVTVSADGVSAKPLPAIITSSVGQYIFSWPHVVSVHFLGERVTVELDFTRSLEDTIEVLEETEAEVGALIDRLPREAWSAN